MRIDGSEAFASGNRFAVDRYDTADRDDTIDIFLSYAREDQRAAVQLSRLLEAAGWTVWWDRHVPAGKTWRFEIEKALRNARCVIVLWSQSSIGSQWVHEEAEEARQAGKLMPVLIEDVRPPPGFREVQTADLTNWNNSPSAPGFRQLSLDINSVLNPSPLCKSRATEAYNSETTDNEAQPKSGKRKIIIALLSAIIFAAGAVLISLSWNWPVAVEGIAPNLPLDPAGPVGADPEPPPASVDAPPVKASPPLAPAEPVELDSTFPEPPPASADAPLTKLPEHDGEQAEPEEPSPKQLERTSRSGVRCGDVLHRLQLGELLSDEDRIYLQRECGR